jgi:hypothetical protein
MHAERFALLIVLASSLAVNDFRCKYLFYSNFLKVWSCIVCGTYLQLEDML